MIHEDILSCYLYEKVDLLVPPKAFVSDAYEDRGYQTRLDNKVAHLQSCCIYQGKVQIEGVFSKTSSFSIFSVSI